MECRYSLNDVFTDIVLEILKRYFLFLIDCFVKPFKKMIYPISKGELINGNLYIEGFLDQSCNFIRFHIRIINP